VKGCKAINEAVEYPEEGVLKGPQDYPEKGGAKSIVPLKAPLFWYDSGASSMKAPLAG
jgi:hypothetical protein